MGVGDPGLRKTSKSRQISDIDRSWEEITQADADAAAQAATAPAAQAAGPTPGGTAAAAVNKVDAMDSAPPAPPGMDAQQDIDILPGSGAMGTDVEQSTVSEESLTTLNTEQSFSIS